ncbi:hypothetical protein [Cellulosimicrobium funkei]|uniref:Uncharacterized protein n=1 Tax=Cellulosimicrobium funkei TaxID=264251 RepID=A0A4Y8R2I2_9MICO|nr:hypothetical protein [Cellulosimicrobium funkei]TFF10545.1 hypothetical protein E1O70_12260 [Cellulosimicrobium funkei]TGA73562.1 hypothetical protein EQW79_009570 [Cellulosimicrobium terreum]
MDNWERLSRYELTDAESSAAVQVLELLVPQAVGEWTRKPIRDGYRIASLNALAEIVQADVASLLANVDTFTYEGALWTSAEGTVRIAQAAAAAHSVPVLAWVHEDERSCRQHTKHGRPSTTGDKGDHTNPDWEFEYYLEHTRPVHELLRQWCGHRAVVFHERLVAAEREVHRLDELLARALGELRNSGAATSADVLGEEHERDRVTPYNVRPLVERPLTPVEIPVRVVYRRAWW